MKVESITAMAMSHGLMGTGFCCDGATGGPAGWGSGGVGAGIFVVSSEGIDRRTRTSYGEVYTKRRRADIGWMQQCAKPSDRREVSSRTKRAMARDTPLRKPKGTRRLALVGMTRAGCKRTIRRGGHCLGCWVRRGERECIRLAGG